MRKKTSALSCALVQVFRNVVKLSMDRVINRKQWNKKTTFSWTYTEIDLGEANSLYVVQFLSLFTKGIESVATNSEFLIPNLSNQCRRRLTF